MMMNLLCYTIIIQIFLDHESPHVSTQVIVQHGILKLQKCPVSEFCRNVSAPVYSSSINCGKLNVLRESYLRFSESVFPTANNENHSKVFALYPQDKQSSSFSRLK